MLCQDLDNSGESGQAKGMYLRPGNQPARTAAPNMATSGVFTMLCGHTDVLDNEGALAVKSSQIREEGVTIHHLVQPQDAYAYY